MQNFNLSYYNVNGFVSLKVYLFPFFTTRFAIPSSKASLALTGLPVRIMSKARLRPINAGKRTTLKIKKAFIASFVSFKLFHKFTPVPPSIKGTPNLLQKTPKIEDSSTTLKSQASANSKPPATAYPLTAAITGLVKNRRVGPNGPAPFVLNGLKLSDRAKVSETTSL